MRAFILVIVVAFLLVLWDSRAPREDPAIRQRHTLTGGCMMMIQRTVRAKNSFGAAVPSTFECVIRLDRGAPTPIAIRELP